MADDLLMDEDHQYDDNSNLPNINIPAFNINHTSIPNSKYNIDTDNYFP